jgi:hypothetical protein
MEGTGGGRNVVLGFGEKRRAGRGPALNEQRRGVSAKGAEFVGIARGGGGDGENLTTKFTKSTKNTMKNGSITNPRHAWVSDSEHGLQVKLWHPAKDAKKDTMRSHMSICAAPPLPAGLGIRDGMEGARWGISYTGTHTRECVGFGGGEHGLPGGSSRGTRRGFR